MKNLFALKIVVKSSVSFIILLMSFSFLLNSCTKNKEELLTEKYWTKYKRSIPNYPVKFTNEGYYINYNKLSSKTKYQIIQNRIIFTNILGEKEKYFIKLLTDKELKLSEISDVGTPDIDYYMKSKPEDYFLGTWIKQTKGHYELQMSANGDAKVEEEISGYIGKKEIKYSVRSNNIISIDGKEYIYKFSDDIIDLELTANDGSVLNLTRKK